MTGTSTGNHVISLSGGKDSTAMLLMMLERGENIHSAVFFDTGWEFPGMLEHIDRIEEYTGISIVRLKPDNPFTYWMFEKPIKKLSGPDKGKIHRIGNSWPSPYRRWCTRIKVRAINNFIKKIKNPVSCIGYAADEAHRSNSKHIVDAIKKGQKIRFTLIEWDISEPEALQYCYDRGFDWDGLYEHFNRVSCFCCPLQRIGDLKRLRKYYPDLWQQMLQWDAMAPEHNRGFRGYQTVRNLEERFKHEESLLTYLEKINNKEITKWQEA